MPPPAPPSLDFFARFVLAWSCFFRILADRAFAARTWQLREAPELVAGPAPPAELPPAPEKKAPPKLSEPPSTEPALQLLALFQREGRLIDFLEQDIASFGDGEVGAAARVVHEGCRKALRSHVKLSAIRAEEEGASATLPAGYSPAEVKLSGNVQGSPPYKGIVRHRGWRAADLRLPTPVKGHDASVIAPAEVEL